MDEFPTDLVDLHKYFEEDTAIVEEGTIDAKLKLQRNSKRTGY